jgi:hypothetical protein
MRRTLLLLLLTRTTHSLCALFLFAPVVSSQGGGSVEGEVVNPNTGQGIAGVNIVLYTRQALRYETTSDAGGGFQIANITPGNYEIRFEKEGYSSGRKQPAQPYRIAAGQAPIRIRLEMSRRATISGRVVDGAGKPVAKAQVKAGNASSATPTSENGEFTIKDVNPGYYTLLAMPPSATESPTKQEQRIEPIATYFPSAPDLSGAQKIVVRGDADIDGLEIRMQAAEVHRVRGVVLNERGSPAAGALVSLAPLAMLPSSVIMNAGMYLTILGAGQGVGPEQARVTADASGAFEFPSVPAGDWQIAATTSGSIDSADFANTVRSGAITALVGGADVDRLQIPMGAPFTVTEAIDWGDLPRRVAVVSLTPADGRFSVATPNTLNADLQPRAVRAVPGRYYVVPSFAAGYYPDSVTLGGRDVLGQAVDLVPGSPPIQVSYKPARGTVRGKVDNAASAIILIPEQITTIGFGRMAQAKADGTFEIAGVAPGAYAIAALLGIDFGARLDPAVLAKVVSSGARVRVEESPVEGIELTAAPWLQ